MKAKFADLAAKNGVRSAPQKRRDPWLCMICIVMALAITGTTLTAGVSTAPEAALPGSVIAGGARAGQMTTITTSLTSFSTSAKALPTTTPAVDANARITPTPSAVKAAGYTTVRAAGAVNAPNSQMFMMNTSARGPLVETDPAFTGVSVRRNQAISFPS